MSSCGWRGLAYGTDDGSQRWVRARAILAAHDLASPFTALTGAFGEGEGGPARYLGQDAVAEFLATWPG
jgi:hypothetical protein